LTDQPNGAATVAEAAPPSCLHCKIRRADSSDNFTIPGHGTFQGPICEWCRTEAADPESTMVPKWSPGEEPAENPRRWRINADRAADILAKIIAWTPAKPDLKFADLFNVANLLRGWVVTKDDRLAGVDNGTLLWRIGLGKLPRSAREREKVLGNAPSAALRAVVLEECMIAAGWRPEDFMVLEPVDRTKENPPEKSDSESEVEALVRDFRLRCDEYMSYEFDNLGPENRGRKKRELVTLAYRIGTIFVTLGEGPKGDWFSKHATAIIEAAEGMSGEV